MRRKAIMQKLIQVAAILICGIAMLAAQDAQNASQPTDGQTLHSANASKSDLSADLAKMHVLLGQMQRNVAFVSSGDTPLKHQFELEIEMWQLLLRDMERKLGAQQNAAAK